MSWWSISNLFCEFVKYNFLLKILINKYIFVSHHMINCNVVMHLFERFFYYLFRRIQVFIMVDMILINERWMFGAGQKLPKANFGHFCSPSPYFKKCNVSVLLPLLWIMELPPTLPQNLTSFLHTRSYYTRKRIYLQGARFFHPPPPTLMEENFVKNPSKCNQYYVLQVSSKSSWTTFKNNFRNFISSGNLSRDHYWRGGIQEIHNLRGFIRISRRIFDIFLWNLFW